MGWPTLHAARERGCKEPGISFLSRFLGRQQPGEATELFLGAFGKHPGWNDHINDPGLETQRLVDLKTLVYVEGIAPNIESGKWDKLEADGRRDGFAHVLLMRSRGDILVARLWNSKDGKGRAKYPMGVAVQLRGGSVEWVLQTVLPELASVERRCAEATTAEQVVSILDSARSQLRARLSAVASDQEDRTDVTIPAGFLERVAAQGEFGPDRQGLHRILYQIHREAEMFELGGKPPSRMVSMGGKGGKGGKGGEADHLTSVHLRIPVVMGVGGMPAPGGASGSGEAAVAEALRGCLRLLLSRLEPWVTTLLIVRTDGWSGGGGWVDAIIGEPQGAQLFALEASEKTLPLTTQIPYTIDAAFASQADGWISSRSAEGQVAVPMASDGSRRSGAGRFLVLALAASAGLAMSAAREAIAQPTSPVPTQAEPRQRYNEALSTLKLAVMNSQRPDSEVSAAITKFLAEVRSLPGGVAYLASVRDTLDTLEDAAKNTDAGSIPADVLTRGPGSGHGYVGVAEGKVLRFKPGVGMGALPELTFARVDMPGGEAVFIGTTEVSVGQYAAIVNGAGGPNDLGKVLRQFDRLSDPRPGPRTWEWVDPTGARGSIRSARAWLASRALGTPEDYPKDAAPPAPTLDSPMQQLAPGGALFAARLIGCRLPTSKEWAAARGQYAGTGRANLRDKAWKDQYDFSVAQRNAGGKQQLPDAGAFAPTGVKLSPPGAALDASDGVLWFTAVQVGGAGGTGAPGGEVVKNLTGNVAEFVLDVAPEEQPPALVGATMDFVQEHGAQIKVIGGSALSDPAIAVETAQPVVLAEAQEGYSDVGFRLCFSSGFSGGQSLAARVNRLLEPLPTLPLR